MLRQWHDREVERAGFSVLSSYVDRAWLPVLGPSSTLALRRLGDLALIDPVGIDVDLAELAADLGLGSGVAPSSRLVHALDRLDWFKMLARFDADLWVRERGAAGLNSGDRAGGVGRRPVAPCGPERAASWTGGRRCRVSTVGAGLHFFGAEVPLGHFARRSGRGLRPRPIDGRRHLSAAEGGEDALREIAYRLRVGHENAGQRTDHGPEFLDRTLYFQLATVQLTDRLLADGSPLTPSGRAQRPLYPSATRVSSSKDRRPSGVASLVSRLRIARRARSK